MNDAPVRGDRLLGSLDDAQRAAVETTSNRVVIHAGPGAGKTRVLAARVVTLLRLRGVQPQEVACFTFTREAAAELRRRIAESVGDEIAAGVTCSTLHGFAAGMLMRVFEGRRVADDDEEESMLRAFVDGPERHPLGRKTGLQAMRGALERYSAGLGCQLPKQTADALLMLHHRFRDRRLLPRWSLVPMAVSVVACEDDPPPTQEQRDAIAALRDRTRSVRHVLVDEAQDLTSAEAALLALFTHASLFAVMDPDQAIYGWRHASPDNLWPLVAHAASAADLTSRVVRYDLSRTYRFGPTLASAATQWIDRKPHLLGRVSLREDARGFDAVSDNADFLPTIDRLARRHGEACTAVLCRTNADCEIAVRAIGKSAIHVTRDANPAAKLIAQAVRLARFTVNPRDDAAAIGLANDFGIGAEVHAWKARAGVRPLYLQAPDDWAPLALAADYAEDPARVPWGRVLAVAVDLLRPLGWERQPFLDAGFFGSESFAGPETSLDLALEGYRQRTEESGFDAARKAGLIAVATIHAAKGREWDAVALVGRPPRGVILADPEDVRVWYVGMTRARRELALVERPS